MITFVGVHPPPDLTPELEALYRDLQLKEQAFRDQIFGSVASCLVNRVSSECGTPIATQFVRAWRREWRVFSFRHQGRERFPLFQFENGAPKAVVEQLLAVLAPWRGWDAMYWFMGANVWLDDASPVELIDTDPATVLVAAGHAHDRVSD